ncbi:hypothetical protein V6Z11_D13G205800 [Gossypium hirsutum]
MKNLPYDSSIIMDNFSSKYLITAALPSPRTSSPLNCPASSVNFPLSWSYLFQAYHRSEYENCMFLLCISYLSHQSIEWKSHIIEKELYDNLEKVANFAFYEKSFHFVKSKCWPKKLHELTSLRL